MGYRRLDTLLDIAKAGYWVRIKCRCGHEARYNPMTVLEALVSRGASAHLNRLSESMKCGRCGGKEFTAEHCLGPEIWSR